jgi:L-alanine-DL-glutamate epimerase-like enolase superfamily enzyme
MNDNQIVSFRTSCYHIPKEIWWPYPPTERKLPMSEITLVTFEVETAGGLSGIGYAQHRGRGGQPVGATLDHIIGPELIGKEIDHPDLLWENLHLQLSRLGSGGVAALALSISDMAVWDVAAKAAGKPLFEFLGARRSSIPAYGSSFDRLYSDEEFIQEAKEYVAAGMKAVKVRVGLAPTVDYRRLSILRDALGPDVRVMVDANQNWDLPTALQRLPMLEEFGIHFLEEPIVPTDAAGFAEIQRHTTIPIAGGENLFTVAEFARFIEQRSLRVLQADIGRIGGVTGWMRVAALGAAYNLPIASHLGQEVSVHVLCAAQNATLLEYIPTFDPIFESPVVVNSDGTISPPATPGIGVSFRQELIEPFRV